MLSPFRASCAVFILLLAASVSILVSPLLAFVPLVAAVSLWAIFRHPVAALGVVLAFMPLDFMAIALGKFLGLPHMTLASVCDKELVLILVAFILWRQNGFSPAAPDRFLFACFLLALIQTAFAGTLAGFALDLDFVIAYGVGRVVVLSAEQQRLWAGRAVWIAAGVSLLGMVEVFVLGAGPRTILYTAIDSEVEGGQLVDSFRGTGLTGLREAATMVGPNGFAALCMIALIIWWVYSRNPLPAAAIAAGLICSVTRSAWVGIIVAAVLLTIRMGQLKRLLIYSGLAVALFLASIPILGLGDYLYYTKTRQDSSAEYHRNQILSGLSYDADHPFGSGNITISPVLSRDNTNGLYFESTYPAFAAAYGIAPALCFIGFLYSSLRLLWRSQSRLAYAAVGILVGMCVVMTFANSLIDRRLVVWAFFPVGLAIRSCLSGCDSGASGRRDIPA